MMMSSDWPMASVREKPKIRVAPGFQKEIIPSLSAATIASETVERIVSPTIRCTSIGFLIEFTRARYRRTSRSAEDLCKAMCSDLLLLISYWGSDGDAWCV